VKDCDGVAMTKVVGKSKIKVGKWVAVVLLFPLFLLLASVHQSYSQSTLRLDQNYPNPFNSETRITFAVPGSGHVTIKVFNMLGKEVRTLEERDFSGGEYHVTFDGSELPSGQYSYTLIFTAGNTSSKLSRKMYLVK